MRVPMIALSTLLLVGIAAADDDSSRAKLMGKWQQSDGEEAAKATWALEEVTADSIRVTNSSGGQTVTEFECNTVGKECTVKDAGRKSKVSLWFNGPKLVEMETKGAQVVKRRFSITGDGDVMELETMPIAPAGKVETSHFKRVPPVVAKQ
jgi:hypothetical protein